MSRKKITKVTEPVRIRTKRLKNGCESLYLDIYTDGKRTYKFLKLYLIPVVDESSVQRNKNTMRAANALKARVIEEIVNRKAGITSSAKGRRITLMEFAEAYCTKHKGKQQESLTRAIMKKFNEWGVGDVLLSEIDKKFCSKLIARIRVESWKDTTKRTYYQRINVLLNEMLRAEFIDVNPMLKIERNELPKKVSSQREYLTIDEVNALIETPCRRDILKRAFLFSCFSGLRISDIERLTWGDIVEASGHTEIKIKQQKTKQEVIIPLSDDARAQLPEEVDNVNDIVFHEFKRSMTLHLQKWVSDAGITKHITFHSARHTFATMLITFGADIYTTSKLLGHASVSTTQIYAKIIDAKRVAAVNLLNGNFASSK